MCAVPPLMILKPQESFLLQRRLCSTSELSRTSKAQFHQFIGRFYSFSQDPQTATEWAELPLCEAGTPQSPSWKPSSGLKLTCSL